MQHQSRSKSILGHPILSAIAIVIVAIVSMIWFSPSGTGENLNSPNGKFAAYVSKMNRGNLYGNRTEYIDLHVDDLASKSKIWQVEYHNPTHSELPDYGSRQQHFITWTADSSSVTIPIQQGQKIILPLP
jgi:hypothetical protein